VTAITATEAKWSADRAVANSGDRTPAVLARRRSDLPVPGLGVDRKVRKWGRRLSLVAVVAGVVVLNLDLPDAVVAKEWAVTSVRLKCADVAEWERVSVRRGRVRVVATAR